MDKSSDNRRPGRNRSETVRGQTTLDFSIGISIFLAVLIFIFLFIPGVLSPFTESTQSETTAANRIADQLATGMLASPSEPYVLDQYCTVEFFNDTGPAQCAYEDEPIDTQLRVDANRQQINVSLYGNVAGEGDELLCWNATEPDTGLVNQSSCTAATSRDVELTEGDSLPSGGQASVTAVRVASLDGTNVRVQVVMW